MILPARAGQADRSDRGVDVHRPAAASPGDAARVHPARPLRAESRRRLRSCSASVGTPCWRALEAEFPEGAVVEPSRRRLLPLARPAAGSRRRRAVRAGRRGGRPVRQGHGLLRRTAAATSRPASRSASRRSRRSARAIRRLGALVREAGRRTRVGAPAAFTCGAGSPGSRARSESASSKVATGNDLEPVGVLLGLARVTGRDDEDVRASLLRADHLLLDAADRLDAAVERQLARRRRSGGPGRRPSRARRRCRARTRAPPTGRRCAPASMSIVDRQVDRGRLLDDDADDRVAGLAARTRWSRACTSFTPPDRRTDTVDVAPGLDRLERRRGGRRASRPSSPPPRR